MTDDDGRHRSAGASRRRSRAENAAISRSRRCRRRSSTQLTDGIIAALKTVYDPEIPADIYELGLIYKVDIADDRDVKIDMTLTAPGCPSAQECRSWWRTRSRACRASRRSRSTVVLDPPGTRAACRTRRDSR